jgi:protein subunit release factor A
VRFTHLPTGIVVSCQNERSQIKNRATALKVLQGRLYELEQRKFLERVAAASGDKADVAWGSQIRSYVLQPYQMVKDHRTGAETSQTQKVLDGDIDVFIRTQLLAKSLKRGFQAAFRAFCLRRGMGSLRTGFSSGMPLDYPIGQGHSRAIGRRSPSPGGR